MGRAPCCDKANVKRGPWSLEEDTKLKTYIEEHGTGGNWITLPHKIGLKRCGKSCRLRWLNYLRPNLKHGGFSEEEDNIICSLYVNIGSRWSIIAAQLPGRTDNDIKNYWNTRLKKKLLGIQRKENSQKGRNSSNQETKKSSVENTITSNFNINQTFPSWPDPIPFLAHFPYSNHEPRFHDHASLKKLLTKLGGKFLDDENSTIQTGPDTKLPIMGSFEVSNSVDTTITSCSSMDALNVVSVLPMLPYPICIPSEFEGMRYDHTVPPRLDGLEFLYDTTTSIEWGDMGNLGYPPIISSYEGILQQECGFDELRHAGVN